MIKLTAKGSFRNSERFFTNSKQLGEKFRQIMDRYGRQGVFRGAERALIQPILGWAMR